VLHRGIIVVVRFSSAGRAGAKPMFISQMAIEPFATKQPKGRGWKAVHR
jgi:hypothetical protein